ncbi:MAG: MarR family winged helix-turn-helix transcriptional regulator [Kineosporiaceae bacterium]
MVTDEPSPRREEMSLLFDVWLLMHLVSGLLDDALDGTGLSGDDFGLYSLLRVFGPATPTQIARWTGMRATTVSAALRRMAGRGHSRTEPNPDDRRSYLVALSPEGVRAHLAAAEPFLAALGHVEASLAPDEHALRLALQRLDAALRSGDAAGARPYTIQASTAADDPRRPWQMPYEGERLTADQEAAVLSYIDFIRAQPAR